MYGAAESEEITYSPPRCCRTDMLLAGEPKVDIHGLTGTKGSILDPLYNILPPIKDKAA
jgi:hypothetical protein